MNAALLLADFAQVVEGKLYIMGAGWSRVPAGLVPNMALAIKMEVPWDQANMPLSIDITLVDADGQPVLDADGNPVHIEGKMEVGRPPGLSPGTPLDAPLAINAAQIVLQPGRYRWELAVDSKAIASAAFEAYVQGGAT